eukprot:1894533-Pleurochrysis_carterae.AAC.1
MTPLARSEMKLETGASPCKGEVPTPGVVCEGAPSGRTALMTRASPAPWQCWYSRPAADGGCPRGFA